ncbi:hypothetical protein OG596_07355 [Streptomyces sp. NBC_01102]|uniref:hypothetical protein n=1 Tax=Streptomyces sp. NBC_01102 TaxID=2903749 RepID=UPI003869A65C|nr:hypothetical protein OG596_07355 [Streptomyces sp. NBC_01102]
MTLAIGRLAALNPAPVAATTVNPSSRPATTRPTSSWQDSLRLFGDGGVITSMTVWKTGNTTG